MRLLIIDASASALDLSVRAQRHGHLVKHFVRRTPKTEHIGVGLVTMVEDYRPFVEWADLIFVADNTKYLIDLDRAREGKLVVGPTWDLAQWELDREAGMKAFRKAGIIVPEVSPFSDYDKAIRHVSATGKRYVSKPSGSDDKSLSYCSKSPADMVYMLESWKQNDKLKGAEFILQEFIEGTEMAVGGWFGPHGFNQGWCENWEFKKLMNDDLGVATGEQGTVLRYVTKSKLASMVLKPLEPLLRRGKYVGYVDVNCIIDKDGFPWPLEFTMRPGWPTFNIQQELHSGDPIQWLMDLANGRDAHTILMDEIAIGVVMSLKGYPYDPPKELEEARGTPIYGITPMLWEHIHPCEMMLARCPFNHEGQVDHCEMNAAAGTYVLVMSARAETVELAKTKVYRRLNRLSVPNSPQWRTDIGDRLSKQLPKLQTHGFAMGMIFR
jgi:phosphoribosylamine--glycine ligase